MIKTKTESYHKQEIDLSGPEGNAFWLIGKAHQFCRQLEVDFTPIEQEMMSGDYENLIKVFDREFGRYVDLVR